MSNFREKGLNTHGEYVRRCCMPVTNDVLSASAFLHRLEEHHTIDDAEFLSALEHSEGPVPSHRSGTGQNHSLAIVVKCWEFSALFTPGDIPNE